MSLYKTATSATSNKKKRKKQSLQIIYEQYVRLDSKYLIKFPDLKILQDKQNKATLAKQ